MSSHIGQLAQDADNNVRAHAARILPALLGHLDEGPIRTVIGRLNGLLGEPGEYVPLAALAGLAESQRDLAAISPDIQRAFRRLRRHPSARVRKAVDALTPT